MGIIGFFALVLIGLMSVFAGIALQFISYGFSGKYSLPGHVLTVLGTIGLVVTWIYKPFTIVF